MSFARETTASAGMGRLLSLDECITKCIENIACVAAVHGEKRVDQDWERRARYEYQCLMAKQSDFTYSNAINLAPAATTSNVIVKSRLSHNTRLSGLRFDHTAVRGKEFLFANSNYNRISHM